MQVKDIMTEHLDTLPTTATIQQASTEMKESSFGFLPVQENGSLAGVITDRDIAIRATANNLGPQTHLSEVMTKNVITVHEDDDVTFAAEEMETKKIRRLVVLDSNEKITGVVSLGDIATKCDNINLNAEIIQAVSEKS